MVDGLTVALFFIPIGLLGAFWGKKLFRFFLPIVAFFFGLGLVLNLTNGTGSIVQLGIGAALGLFFAIMAFLFYKIGFLIFFVGVGFFLFSVLTSLFSLGDSAIFGLGGAMVFGLVFGLIAMFSKLDDIVIILASAFLGANYVLLGLMSSAVRTVDIYNLQGSIEAHNFSTISSLFFLAIYLLTLIGGIMCQLRHNK